MRKVNVLAPVFALYMLVEDSGVSGPNFGNLPALWTRSHVESMPTNPPPLSTKQIATEPAVYLGDTIAPEGAFRIYTGFARGVLSRQPLVEGDANIAQKLFLIGVGDAPTLKYNEVSISNVGSTYGSFKATLTNYFVFPNQTVERVTQIVFVQPAGDISQPLDSQSVLGLIVNQIQSQFTQIPVPIPNNNNPIDPPIPLFPQPAASNIHALIISGAPSIAEVVDCRNLTHLFGGIIALRSGSGGAVKALSSWSQRLTVTPDQELMNGTNMPPITLNVVDIRIRHYGVEAKMDTSHP